MSAEKIKQTIEHLRKGNILLYPTDTLWGIGCDATNPVAVEKVFALKKRSDQKSLIALVHSVAFLERYVKQMPEVCYELLDNSDKPLTIVYENPINIAENAVAEDGSMGFRVTTDPICQRIIQQLNKPLISTSANLSGDSSPTCFDDVSPVIKSGVDFILDERTKEKMTKPSTIIKINNDSSFKIIRK
ncbi:MAG: L-threonylcarbamoyladenylate synthase [Crocinitomicaceae bacterium]|nr:L-threonylcarbamoyladenylate synthase [Crocinitomicaceae bacterium]